MKKLQQEQNIHRDKISSWVVAILVFLVFALSAGRIFVANRLVESSDKLRKMDGQITQLQDQNQVLAEEIRHLESTGVIEQKALASGFSVNRHFAFLTPTVQIAFGLSP